MMSVARLLALIRHDLVYSVSNLSRNFSSLAFAFADWPDSGIPQTAPAKWDGSGASGKGGGGGSLSSGEDANSADEGSVAAISETQVIVFPSPI